MTRLERLSELLVKYQQTVEDYDEEVEEDLRPYFSNRDRIELGRYCCVTVNYSSHGHAKYFFLPRFETSSDARQRAYEFISDEIFEEIPVEVVDLDTGEAWEPLLHLAPWQKR